MKNNKNTHLLVILNSTADLQRLSLQLVNSMRGRSRIKYGMTSLFNHGGFTLIELLVVVLIIGILAAVAVPQYQKAVLKSRFATIKDLTQSIAQAEEIYYLANGQYTHNADELDINMPTPTSSKITTTGSGRYFYPWGYCIIENKDSQKLVYCILSNEKNVTSTSITNRILAYWIGLSHDNFEDYVGKRACFAYGSDANSIQCAICKKETDKKKADLKDTTIRGWYYE